MRLPCPWDSPGKNTGVGCHFLLQSMKVKLLSCVRLLATPWTAAYQAPLSMGFSRQEYWSGVPLQHTLKHFKNVFLLFTLKYPELLTFFYLLLLNIISLFIQEYTHFYPADTLNVLIYCGHIFSDLYVALMRF